MTRGRLCLQVDDSTLAVCLTKPEAMIHNEQARKNYLDPEAFTEHWRYKELVSILLLSLYKVGPYTGLLATY